MWIRAWTAAAIVAAGGMIGGCASDGNIIPGGLTTSSVEPSAITASQSKVDAHCVALMSKIDQLRKEGTPGRIEKISTGKGATATVKRTALARITELDKANAEFQSRCSTMSPAQQAAAQTAPAPVAATDQAKQATALAAEKSATKTVAKAATAPAATAAKAAAAE